jgi:hypothetical protein
MSSLSIRNLSVTADWEGNRPSGQSRGVRDRSAGRWRVRQVRRTASKVESNISHVCFPKGMLLSLGEQHRSLTSSDLKSIERGLREWFICCAWRGNLAVGLPSRLIGECWKVLIIDTIWYTAFCRDTFGEYVHRFSGKGMEMPMAEAMEETVRAWDRSRAGAEGDSILWDLDERLSHTRPLGLDSARLESARTRIPYPAAYGWIGARRRSSWPPYRSGPMSGGGGGWGGGGAG